MKKLTLLLLFTACLWSQPTIVDVRIRSIGETSFMIDQRMSSGDNRHFLRWGTNPASLTFEGKREYHLNTTNWIHNHPAGAVSPDTIWYFEPVAKTYVGSGNYTGAESTWACTQDSDIKVAYVGPHTITSITNSELLTSGYFNPGTGLRKVTITGSAVTENNKEWDAVYETGNNRLYIPGVATCTADCGTFTFTEYTIGVDYGCDETNGVGWVKTRPLSPNWGEASSIQGPIPALVNSIPRTYTPTLAPLTVAANNQADFVSKLATCVANTQSSTAVQEILLPPGSVYKRFTVPARAGEFGECVIRTDSNALPPPGIRATLDYLPYMARIEIPSQMAGQVDDRGVFILSADTQGFRFVGIDFTWERPWIGTPLPEYTITNVSDNGTCIEIAETLPDDFMVGNLNIAEIYGVVGTWNDDADPNGVFLLGNRFGATCAGINASAYRRVQVNRPFAPCTSGGCYVSGGKIRIGAPQLVQTAVGNRVTFARPHGITNRNTVNITSITGNVISVDDNPYSLSTTQDERILISGSSVTAWNGFRNTTGQTSTSVTVSGTASGDCSSSCGTLRFMTNIVAINGATGNDGINGTWNADVVDDYTLDLLGATGTGEYTGGGLMAWEPTNAPGLVSIYRPGAKRFIIERSLVRAEWPFRVSSGILLTGQRHAVFDSSVIANWWLHVRPGVNDRKTIIHNWPYHPTELTTSIGIEITRTQIARIENNDLGANGFTIYAQDLSTIDPSEAQAPAEQQGPGYVVHDILIKRNRMWKDDAWRASSPTNKGSYFGARHHLEFKRGERIEVIGNIMDRNWIDFNPCGPSNLITPLNSSSVSDITWSFNTLLNIPTAFYFAGLPAGNATSGTMLGDLTRRIRMANNEIYRQTALSASPRETSDSGCAYAFYATSGFENYQFVNNTVYKPQGAVNLAFRYLGSARGGQLRFDNNLFVPFNNNDTNDDPPMTNRSVSTNVGTPNPPSVSMQLKPYWEAVYGLVSTHANNIYVPGTKNARSPATYNSTLSADNYFRSHCDDMVGSDSGFSNICLGSLSNNDTPQQRVDLAGLVAPDTDRLDKFDLKFDSPAGSAGSDGRDIGVDQNTKRRVQGTLYNEKVTSRSSTTATITFSFLTDQPTDQCYIRLVSGETDVAPIAGTTDMVASIGGGGSYTIEDLSPNTQYHARLMCPGNRQPVLPFSTTP